MIREIELVAVGVMLKKTALEGRKGMREKGVEIVGVLEHCNERSV